MQFTREYLMELADQFEKKAEQLLETAESIRDTASIMSPGNKPQKEPPAPQPAPSPPAKTPPPRPPTEEKFRPQPGYAPPSYEKNQTKQVSTHHNDKPSDDNQPTFSPLEQHILDSLESHMEGLRIVDIIGYCKQNGIGTHGSVQFAIGKLVKAGHVARLDRGQYALPTAFNSAQKELN